MYSIAEFGSTQRLTNDKYSDKDLLIVSNCTILLNAKKAEFQNKGFSVSTYTYKKLAYLSNAKSLFIDHLIQESNIQKDWNGSLKSILDSHISKINFEIDLNNTINYFKFLNKIPDIKILFSWFCDCFYVGLRNYLILKSAESKQICFSYLELINQLFLSKIINHDELAILKNLRVVKKNYRDKINDENPSIEFVIDLAAIGVRLKLLNDFAIIPNNNFQYLAKRFLKNPLVNNYCKIRIYEALYKINGEESDEIEKIVTNPQMYSYNFKDSKYISKMLDKFSFFNTHLLRLSSCPEITKLK